MNKEIKEFFNEMFQQLLPLAKDPILIDVISLYAEDDWAEKPQNLKGAFTFVGNMALEFGETELSQMARDMRDECEMYFPES